MSYLWNLWTNRCKFKIPTTKWIQFTLYLSMKFWSLIGARKGNHVANMYQKVYKSFTTPQAPSGLPGSSPVDKI